ncbi:GMC oxidoreductase [Aplosporella prunicola CBS 121167]|uniref:GMC oxidoreductase n=1 Tax=Aplosporella prunicola CBS 121167 TaxID=1176127 RepID=A0A6A6B4Y7_9PEZI|nr:GMC oxidoreductase [Aplosporella prunicola CBS 121167]KAF2139222.1 GMC oxidoreductase [Aplosporella prunicola CBS 121167]
MLPTFVSAFLAAAVLALTANCSPIQDNKYDYIVVGGGTSGLVIANRLSKDPDVSVAIIEAGDSVLNNPNVTTTEGYGKAFGSSIDWQYESVPQAFAGNKTQTMRAGKALGGTSTINGMTYLRAEKAQIDALERLGNDGWNWTTLLPYYKKSEHFQWPSAMQVAAGATYGPKVHGYMGNLYVGWVNDMMYGDIITTLVSTFGAMDIPFNQDPNDGEMRGFSLYPRTVRRIENVREDAARAYYWPIADRKNLHLYLNTSVDFITWEKPINMSSPSGKPVASGVHVTCASGEQKFFEATREVILSAGALRSPPILEHSGVGNSAILKKFGIDVVVDLPSVGENLQDQANSGMVFSSKPNPSSGGAYVAYLTMKDLFSGEDGVGPLQPAVVSLNDTVASSIKSYAEQVVNATGGAVNATALERLYGIQHDLLFNTDTPAVEILVGSSSTSSMFVSYWPLMPFSRGNIHITSGDPHCKPDINPNFFMMDYDMHVHVQASKMARRLANTSSLKQHITNETEPGLDVVPENADDADWAKWIKNTYRTNYHYIATAAMLPRELGGVVDNNLLVYGTANVRVVDGSVIPFQMAGHATSTLYAIAEKVAEAIKAKHAS